MWITKKDSGGLAKNWAHGAGLQLKVSAKWPSGPKAKFKQHLGKHTRFP